MKKWIGESGGKGYHHKAFIKDDTYYMAINDLANRLGIEIIIKNKENKPISGVIVDYVWRLILIGAFVDSTGGIKDWAEKAAKL